ncbi:MAG: methylated-DNA--[protein]-cysteine S-methyltransferase [Bdellovibrionales bacterium]|nr:methylated-DNA--[protein]-cysteine S-methyltransferase [Bdellovibrionales bacterium]
MESSIGPLFLVASSIGLKGIFWKEKNIPFIKSLNGDGKSIQILLQTISEVSEYLQGCRRTFNVPLDIEGSDFQKKVWKKLTQIPYGTTCSYKEIAQKLKDPNKARAVGSANGKNPISLIVPCHRVINASGKLGGYAGGLKIKEHLLLLEQIK